VLKESMKEFGLKKLTLLSFGTLNGAITIPASDQMNHLCIIQLKIYLITSNYQEKLLFKTTLKS
jgi:hypothetical protein